MVSLVTAYLMSYARFNTIGRMLYCSPVWWGFTDGQEREVREGIIRKLLRLGYLLLPTPSFKALCYTSDSNLFACILNNSCNVGLLHKLLPRPSVPPPCMPDSPKVQTCPLFGAARTSYRSFLNPNK